MSCIGSCSVPTRRRRLAVCSRSFDSSSRSARRSSSAFMGRALPSGWASSTAPTRWTLFGRTRAR
eukprot:4515439-Prymnesium_polylepis.1